MIVGFILKSYNHYLIFFKYKITIKDLNLILSFLSSDQQSFTYYR